jgi:hypothetical protein
MAAHAGGGLGAEIQTQEEHGERIDLRSWFGFLCTTEGLCPLDTRVGIGKGGAADPCPFLARPGPGEVRRSKGNTGMGGLPRQARKPKGRRARKPSGLPVATSQLADSPAPSWSPSATAELRSRPAGELACLAIAHLADHVPGYLTVNPQ